MDFLELTQPVLPILQAYDYHKQNEDTQRLIGSLPLPLSLRFRIRPLTLEDIPSAAHMLSHVFGSEANFGKYLKLAKFYQQVFLNLQFFFFF
jgi:hypothetical protein